MIYRQKKTIYTIILALVVLAGVFGVLVKPSLSQNLPSGWSWYSQKDNIAQDSNGNFWKYNPAVGYQGGGYSLPHWSPVDAEGKAKAGGVIIDNTTPDGPSFIARFIGWITGYIVKLEGGVLGILTRILMWLMSYNDFVAATAVQKGWTLVRDVSNMFFVLVLLALAIGTILHIESYNFKRLLPKVLIMAVLVNFSLLICGLIIDFAQVVMMTFVATFAASGESNLVATLNIKEMITATEELTTQAGQGAIVNAGMVVASALLAVALLLIAIVVVLVMLAVILMRIIMLWLLVVLSPLAYILAALPQGQRYAQQWWQEFSKYVIIGPVLAFFLWLTFAIAGAGGKIEPTALGKNVDPTKLERGSAGSQHFFTKVGDASGMLSFIIAIGMLMGSLMITQQMGVAGGQLAGAAFGKIRQAGLMGLRAMAAPVVKPVGWAAKTVGLAAHRQLARGKVTRWALPSVWQEARKLKRERLEKAVYPRAAGEMADVFNKYRLFNFGRRGEKTHEGLIAQGREVSERKNKQLQSGRTSTEELLYDLEKGAGIKDITRREVEVSALVDVLESGNMDINEIFKDADFEFKYPKAAEAIKAEQKLRGEKENPNTLTPENLRLWINSVFDNREDVGARVAIRLGYTAWSAGDMHLKDLGRTDLKTGESKWTPPLIQDIITAVFLNKLNAREFNRKLRWQVAFPEEAKRDTAGQLIGTMISKPEQEVRRDAVGKWREYDKATGKLGKEVSADDVSHETGRVNQIQGGFKVWLNKFLTRANLERLNEMRPETLERIAEGDEREGNIRGTDLIRQHATRELAAGNINTARYDLITEYAEALDVQSWKKKPPSGAGGAGAGAGAGTGAPLPPPPPGGAGPGGGPTAGAGAEGGEELRDEDFADLDQLISQIGGRIDEEEDKQKSGMGDFAQYARDMQEALDGFKAAIDSLTDKLKAQNLTEQFDKLQEAFKKVAPGETPSVNFQQQKQAVQEQRNQLTKILEELKRQRKAREDKKRAAREKRPQSQKEKPEEEDFEDEGEDIT